MKQSNYLYKEIEIYFILYKPFEFMLILNKGDFITAIIIIPIFIRSSGWLTPRSREKTRNNAVIIQLAAVSIINRVIINTRPFSDNAPYAVSVDVCFLSQVK
jgi:hypothetical protein